MKPEDIKWLDEETAEQPEEEAEETAVPEEGSTPPPRSSRGRIWLIVLAILILAAALFYASGAYRRLFNPNTTYTLQASTEPVSYTADSQTKVYPFGRGALHLSVNGVEAFDANGDQIWDQPYTMGWPHLTAASDYAAVADLGGSQILLLDHNGLVRAITTEAPILECSVNNTGCTAAIMESGDSNILAVYDRSGNVLVRRVTYSDQDGIPLAIAINDDATCMATAYTVYTETELVSAVTLFNLTDTAADSIDRIAGNYNYPGTLVTDIHYLDDELIVVGDNLLAGIRTTGNTKEDWTESISFEINAVAFGTDFIALKLGGGLIGVAGEPDANLLLIGKNGSHILEKKLAGFRQLLASNNILVYQDGFDYFAVDAAGKELWRYTVENGMQLYAVSGKLALGNTGSSLQFFKVVAADAE